MSAFDLALRGLLVAPLALEPLPRPAVEAPSRRPALPPVCFVDAIEEGRVRCLDGRGRARSADARALPPGTAEGQWLVQGRRSPAREAELRSRIERRWQELAPGTVDGGRR